MVKRQDWSKSANYINIGAQRNPATDYEASSRIVNDTEYTNTSNIEVMNASDVAELLQISNWMIYELVKRNEIPHLKVGRNVRFIRFEIVKWMLG